MKNLTLSILLFCTSAFALSAEQMVPSSRPPIGPPLIEIETKKSDPIKLQIAVSSENSKPKEVAFLGIPDVVWSGVIGSLIAAVSAIAVLIISNGHNQRRQVEDHKQEMRENDRGRKHELRKEVYLNLSDATITAHSYYTKIAISDFDKELDIAPHHALLTSLFKIVLVGDPCTQAVAHNLVASYGRLYFTSLEWRVKFFNLERKLKGEPTSAELHQQKIKLLDVFMNVFMSETAPLRKLQAKLLVEVKRELGIESDLSELEQQFDKMAKDAINRYKEFSENLSK